MQKQMLRNEYKRKGLSTADFCRKIGMIPSTFYRKCSNDGFSVEELVKIADVIGYDAMLIIFFPKRCANLQHEIWRL